MTRFANVCINAPCFGGGGGGDGGVVVVMGHGGNGGGSGSFNVFGLFLFLEVGICKEIRIPAITRTTIVTTTTMIATTNNNKKNNNDNNIEVSIAYLQVSFWAAAPREPMTYGVTWEILVDHFLLVLSVLLPQQPEARPQAPECDLHFQASCFQPQASSPMPQIMNL